MQNQSLSDQSYEQLVYKLEQIFYLLRRTRKEVAHRNRHWLRRRHLSLSAILALSKKIN